MGECDVCVFRSVVMQYFSEKVVRDADPGLTADEKKYQECVTDGHSWATKLPTQSSCRRYYRWAMNVNRTKKVCLDPNTIKKKGEALWRFMTQSIYSDDEDVPGYCRVCRSTPCSCTGLTQSEIDNIEIYTLVAK